LWARARAWRSSTDPLQSRATTSTCCRRPGVAARAPVDLVYIDPPYNTGNEFAYRDDFRRDGRGTAPGLGGDDAAPARGGARALATSGAIFVSIDDNEVAHLRLLMDEVFGERNFLAQVVVNLNPKGRQLGKGFATSHEYLLVYARSSRSACSTRAACTR
jgi:adenine-specific DNA-methyltransferase